MSTGWTARASSRNFYTRALHYSLIGLAAIVPVATMGITLPSALEVSEARDRQAEVRARLSERDALERRLEDWSQGNAVETLAALEQRLAELIPVKLSPIREFGVIRAASRESGVPLEQVRIVRTHGIPGSDSLVADEVLVTAATSLGTALRFIDEIRASGLATVVLGFDVSRTDASQSVFQTELRLGFLRRVPHSAQGQPGPQSH